MTHAHTSDDLSHHCTLHTHKNFAITPNAPIVIGVDEVGRGSLFGQMTVAGVILPPMLAGEFDALDLTNTALFGLSDSKKLSEKKRLQLNHAIKSIAQSYAIIDIPPAVIDDINIYQATLLGMRLVIENLIKINQLQKNTLNILIDGNAAPILSAPYGDYQPCLQTIVKGDDRHSSIAAASILAKVHRDTSMLSYGECYPAYALHKNKGYASAAHRHAIMRLGVLPEHRKSFEPIKSLISQADLFD